jgi:hypothetical protein
VSRYFFPHVEPKDKYNSRVVDPYSFFPDPDTEFEAGDQSGSNPDPDPIRIQGFNDQKLKKNYN